MNSSKIIELENRLMANVYSKKQIVISRGKGAILWDANGKEYIDCMSNYGVSLVGHSHPKVIKTIKEQSEVLISCHGSLYNEVRSLFLQRLIEIMPKGLNKVFLSNSGAESVECAIKLARKFTAKKEIIAMVGGYHGKTMGALSATWNKKYRIPYEPLVPCFKHVPYGNSSKVRENISEDTAAILVEPIQGEGGVRMPPPNFLRELREICNHKDILLILDEVQTGFGRTGKMFACQHSNVVPDILCLAKPLAGGLPIGATVSREDIMSSFKLGEHSSTFGGSALICAIGITILDIIKDENLTERAAKIGSELMARLNKLKDDCKIIREVRGSGLMIGVEIRFDVLNILLKSLERGLLIVDSGRNVVRILPPLVITKEQIDSAFKVFSSILREEEDEKLRS